MNDNLPANNDNNHSVWPPPIYQAIEVENHTLLSETEHVLTELNPSERILVAGRWWFTVAIIGNLLGFIWKVIEHLHHWWRLGIIPHWWRLAILVLLPFAVKGWRLWLKERG